MGYVPSITAPVVAGKITAAGFGAEVDNSIAALASPPRCSLSNTSNINIGAGNGTMLTWDTEEYDTDTMHSTSSNTSRIIATTAGTYRFTLALEIDNTSSGSQQTVARLLKNAAGSVTGGSAVAQVSALLPNVASVATLYIARTVVLSAADYIEVAVKRVDGVAGCFVASGAAVSYVQAELIAYP